ncbi:MAG TPA: hypothetical protein DEP05_05355 [Betaproteobacteria bacterium]|nr:hypothetical protein [Betaproteobacteria bacterium]
MKLHVDAVMAGRNLFTGYGEGYVVVNGARYQTSVIVLPDKIIPWPVAGFDSLGEADFALLEQLAVDIVLLGAGETQRFLHPRLTQRLGERGIGLDVMNTPAACRTFNILLAEERRVAAALLW